MKTNYAPIFPGETLLCSAGWKIYNGDALNRRDDRIKELEAKLAAAEKEIAQWREHARERAAILELVERRDL